MAVWVVFAALVFGLIQARWAHAQELVVFDDDSPPYMSLRDGQAVGLYPSIVAEAFRRMGEALRLEAAPWVKVLGCLEAGVCGVGGISRNFIRSERFDYSDPIYVEKVLVYVAGQGFPFESLDDLAGKRLGVIRGYTYGDAFDKAAASGRVTAVEGDSDLHNFQDLRDGKLDAVLSSKEKAELTLARLGLERTVRPLDRPIFVDGVYLAFNMQANKKDLLKRFNAALASMRGDGTLDALVARSVRVR
ncbi:hypothetical protein JCM15519_13940 [Fundidesulfovibrio butyratiphilus]